MSRADEPAYPSADVIDHERNFYSYGGSGLTVREHFAGLALVGMLQRADYDNTDCETIAAAAVESADALMAELAKVRA